MNAARHAAFGKEAASMVLKSSVGEWPEVCNFGLVPLFPMAWRKIEIWVS